MSRKNYTNYSKGNNVAVDKEPVVTEEPIEVTVEPTEPIATEVPEKAEIVHGYVSGCSKLNVRKGPGIDARPLTIISENTEVEIDMANSTDEWYGVITASGVEGFCMKKYITIK